jgi:branched-chain amino acid transport system permease protein
MISEVASLLLDLLMLSSIYVLATLGFALVFSVMRIMNFAHGAIYMAGGYLCYYFWVVFGLNPWVSLAFTMLVTAMFGLFIEKFCFRPFQLDFEKAIVMAVALVIILQTAANLTVGPSVKGLPALLTNVFRVGGITLKADRIVVFIICILLLAALTILIQKSKVGQAMLAIAQDRDAAALQGINTNRISAFACALGCGLAGLAGGLVGSVLVLHVGMSNVILVKIIAVVILAGIGSIGGIWAGSLILGALDSVLPYILPAAVSESFGLGLIILILLVRPRGLFGQEV